MKKITYCTSDLAQRMFRLTKDAAEGKPVKAEALQLLQSIKDEHKEQEGLDQYRHAADGLTEDGHIEVDPGALVSKGDDEGAYVQAWLWVADSVVDGDE